MLTLSAIVRPQTLSHIASFCPMTEISPRAAIVLCLLLVVGAGHVSLDATLRNHGCGDNAQCLVNAARASWAEQPWLATTARTAFAYAILDAWNRRSRLWAYKR